MTKVGNTETKQRTDQSNSRNLPSRPVSDDHLTSRPRKKACYTSLYWAIGLVGVFFCLALFTDLIPSWILSGDDALISDVKTASVDPSYTLQHNSSGNDNAVKNRTAMREGIITNIFSATEKAADSVANLIYQRYEFHRWDWFQFFLVSWNINQQGWEILKYKFARKVVLALKKANYFHHQSQDEEWFRDIAFVMIFSGSSVTAGYDNHYNQSYPSIISKRLGPVLDSLDIPLVVKNIAQNRVDCRLTNYCFASMAGYFEKSIRKYNPEKADVISWENSFSCSRDKDVFEYFARLAASYEAVAYFSASGGFSPINCGPAEETTPWVAEEWTPNMIPITERKENFRFSQALVTAYKQVQQDWYDDGNSVARFASFLGEDYEGIAPHGYNAWGKSKSLCQIPLHIQKLLPSTSMKKEKDKNGDYLGGCEGVHLIQEWCHQKRFKKSKTHGWVSEVLEEQGPHWMVWDASRRGDGMLEQKTWHPPAAMHMLRGELLVYNYLHILMDAIYMLKTDLGVSEKIEIPSIDVLDGLVKKYSKELRSLQTPIPKEPQYCADWECNFHQSPTACYSEFGPIFDENNNGRSMKLSSIFIGLFDHWDKTDLIYLNNADEYGYQDVKYYYSVAGPNRELHLKLYNVRHGVIKLYGINGKYRFQGIEIFLDPHIDRVALDKALEKDPHHEYVPTKHRYELKKMTYHTETDHVHITDIPPGDHVLILKTPDFHPIARFSLSHLVVF